MAVFSKELPRVYSRSRVLGPRREYYFRGRGYYRIPVSSIDALEGANATLTFIDTNPGDTTEKYYHAYWKKVEPLTDIAQQLIIPSHTHYILRQGVISLVTSEQYGNGLQMISIMEEIAKRIRNQLNRGTQARVMRTPIQPEYQTYPDFPYYGDLM